MTRVVGALVVLALAGTAVAGGIDGRRLRVVGGRLADRHGREITLRGVNARVDGVFDVTFDDGRQPLEPIPTFDQGDADRMRAFGFNLLRLPVNWSALEPARGQVAKTYLDRIAAVVHLCARRGILVIIDFHQDAFSKEIGQDGAPRWVLDLLLGAGNYPYLGGPLTDLDARRFAPATLAAFEQFFRNDQDVQGLFAKTAAALAKRFRNERAVAGYEIMNEPLVLSRDGENDLRRFHERVGAAIRAVDRNHLIVFEPNVTRNITNSAPLPATRWAYPPGLYAPHIYTYVFDGQTFTGDSSALVASMDAAAAEAAAWGTPLFVGEYGIDPTHPLADAWITASLDQQDRVRAHSTFWLWEEISSGHWGLFAGESSEPGGERVDRTTALSRVYARAVPGRVIEHAFDAAADHLRLRWQAGGGGPLELFVPARRFPNGAAVTCDGKPVRKKPDRNGVLRLSCGGRRGEHVVEIAPAA